MRKTLQNLLLGVVSAALFLAAVEGGSRFIESRRPPPPERADYIWDWQKQWQDDFYTLASDESGWPPGAEFNGDGLRDRMHAEEKPAGVLRVAFLGDSVTLGHGLEPEEAFPQRLQQRFDAEGRPVEVMSVALWGWSTRQERLAYERILRRYRPDRILLAVCLNDIPEIKNNLERPPDWLLALHERSALVRLLVNAPGREIRNVEELFTRRDSSQVREGFELFFQELRALRDEVARDGASLAVIVFPFRFQLGPGAPPPTVQAAIAAFCTAERLPLLDLLPALRRAGADSFLDYDHLSEAGARLVADAIAASGILEAPASAAEVLAVFSGASGPPPLASVTRALDARDVAVRAAAAWAVGKTGRRAASLVLRLARAVVEDDAPRVRVAAARALGAIGPGAAAARPSLLKALADMRAAVRWAAADALYRIGLTADAAPALVEALRSEDAYVRAFATYSLGELGGAAGEVAAAALAETVRSEGGAGRSGAAAALAKMGGGARQAVPALIEELKNEREARRWRAARTLGRIGPEAAPAVPGLVVALRDPDVSVRLAAARALGRIGSRDAIAGLVGAVKSDTSRQVREEASKALSRIPGS